MSAVFKAAQSSSPAATTSSAMRKTTPESPANSPLTSSVCDVSIHFGWKPFILLLWPPQPLICLRQDMLRTTYKTLLVTSFPSSGPVFGPHVCHQSYVFIYNSVYSVKRQLKTILFSCYRPRHVGTVFVHLIRNLSYCLLTSLLMLLGSDHVVLVLLFVRGP